MQVPQTKPASNTKPLTFEVPKAPSIFRRPPPRGPLKPAPFLPMSREEMKRLGWDQCDIILVTGDAYVDHPSFGMALVGRLLEAQGFRVGIISQPGWQDAEDFKALGAPRLFFGVTAGNMDSMVNRYTADRKIRSDDAYTPGGEGGRRPDRSTLVYAQRCKEAFKGVPIILGGIEASLRRIAHYDYWSEKIRRSILMDAKADLLLYGNAERALVEVAHRLEAGESIKDIRDIRGTAYMGRGIPEGFAEIDSQSIDTPGPVTPHPNPYAYGGTTPSAPATTEEPEVARAPRPDFRKTFVRMPSFEAVKGDPILYAHASRILHREANPGNARGLIQGHGDRDLILNPPPIPLTTPEMDRVYELPYRRLPHPKYGKAKIPAYEMIRFSVTIQRGCFGGCTFCSITEHEGRIIQNRSKASILKEVKGLKEIPGFTGVVSDLGGPTANMYRIACKSKVIEAACRRPSCVYPKVCENLNTDHSALIDLYRGARATKGVKRVNIASGVRYDLAVEDPAYVKELVTHHVGGYLKIAPEHTEEGPLSKMMKPGIGTYDRFKELFDKFSKEAGKKQYLIPYFIAAHPGTTIEDMIELALWLKSNGYKADQVQTFLPSPMSTATAMYHSGKNPLAKVTRESEDVPSPKGLNLRRLHKAFLRYHDPANWPKIREALKARGRGDLIGKGPGCLVPAYQPKGGSLGRRGSRGGGHFRTQHTGLKNAATTGGGKKGGPSKGRGKGKGRRGSSNRSKAGGRG